MRESLGSGDAHLEEALTALRECRGVLAAEILSEEDKKRILDVESKVEEKTILGMCKSFNKGVRESLQREFVIAMVIRTSEFEYPHHPYMNMICGDQVVGELINDEERIEELRRNPTNLFIWKNFVVYMRKLSRDPKERSNMRIVYLPREPVQLGSLPHVENSVFGTPSTEGDALIKRMLNIKSKESVVGTCLVGFDIKPSS